MTTKRTFPAIADEAVNYLLQTSPVRATTTGIHDFDSELDSADKARRVERNRRFERFIAELQEIAPADLASEQRIDHEILSKNLCAEITFDRAYRRWDRDPTLPLEVALYGCLALIERDFAPLDERVSALIARVQAIPNLLEKSIANLSAEREVPTVWAEMAEDLCVSAQGFLSSLTTDVAPRSQQGSLLSTAAETAKIAIARYEKFLKSDLTSRSRGSYACGWEVFASLLEDLHGLKFTAAELIQFGESEIARIESEIAAVAGEIDSARNADEILAELKSTPPVDTDLLKVYAGFVAASEEFIRDRELITLPANIELSVIETPEFVRHTYPFAAYSTPAIFDLKQTGMFWVTPVAPNQPAEQLAESLRNHNPFQSHLIALHEGFPGHHVQLSLAARLDSRVRKLFDSNVFVEGWALYCEELMWEEGYFQNERYRLMQLYLELWRACRVVIDVKLHSGAVSFTDAVNLLVDTAKLDKLSAIAEVKRYSQSPTQPLSYLVGKKEILKLRSDCRKAWGNRFSLKLFHDRLLALGSVPLGIARRVLLEQM